MLERKEWLLEDMQLTLVAFRDDGMPERQAAKLYNEPHKTLADRINCKVKSDTLRLGSAPALDETAEEALCNYITTMAKSGFPLTITQVKTFACVGYHVSISIFS